MGANYEARDANSGEGEREVSSRMKREGERTRTLKRATQFDLELHSALWSEGQDMHSDISLRCSLLRNASYSPAARRSADAGFRAAAA